ncbi:MAG: DegT/DnrJ/EryC1/StrS family aminotransferase, partial [Lachnospiraceae bacterium]|nr:DegT/DnrJ/EryC1/StrS family aminotransferase [Lachnospiraceae bacterium]
MSDLAIFGGTPVRKEKLYYGHQCIDSADIDAVVEVLKSDYLTCGPKITELEQKLCALTGAKYAVVCSNGTAA